MPINVIAKRWACATKSFSSAVSPEFDIKMQMSPSQIIPKSPWLASAACTKYEGVPVLARVADNFRPICPDLPMPETITRPLHLIIDSTISEKSCGMFLDMMSIACDCAFKTRLAIIGDISVNLLGLTLILGMIFEMH